jgi:NAD(P)H-hydrate epimerase
VEDLMKLVTVAEMKGLERAADEAGHTYATMMEQAGRAVAQVISSRTKIKGQRVLVLVGPGNNGGDGLVAARYLREAGAQVSCCLWKPRRDDDPNWMQVRDLDILCLNVEQGDGDILAKAAQTADVIVDALLGTGASRPIEGELKQILQTVGERIKLRRATGAVDWTVTTPPAPPKAADAPLTSPVVVAVDVPSGLDCDSGETDLVTLPADLTVTFAAPKRGQYRFPGVAYVGELVVADIGIDPQLSADLPTELLTAQRVGSMLPPRPLNAHKGTFGKAIVVAGSINYTGAPYLAAAAAGRVGAGLVTLAPPAPLHPILAAKLSEATFLLLPHDMGVLIPDAIRVLGSRLESYRAMLLGPGLGRERGTVEFVHQLLGISSGGESRRIGFRREQGPPDQEVDLPPLVIDADGLNALADVDGWWTCLPEGSVLTPHPGEMERLIQEAVAGQDRVALAREQSAAWRQVVVLKGAHTVVAAPDGRVSVVPFANPGLATAGTGDVLAGAIVGLLAQGLGPFEAATCGAYVHGLAGEIAAAQMGMSRTNAAGLLAGDLLPALPRALARLRS